MKLIYKGGRFEEEGQLRDYYLQFSPRRCTYSDDEDIPDIVDIPKNWIAV